MNKIPHKWRNLPIKSKLEIPKKYFNLDKNEIDIIRRIKNPKNKLIESAKIQYESFKEIHSYLTAWIAGYSSDVIVRKYFGSTKNLRERFIKSPKIIKGISPSWSDIKRGIKIPEQMNEELAEEIGIHIGDGNLHITTHEDGSKSYKYSITGDLKDEELYHENHIRKLMKNLYNIESSFSKRENKNSIESIYRSKTIVEYKNQILKLSIGKKKDIKIPKEIMNNKKFQKKCVVGIIDTDFSVTKFLAISGKMNNLNATNQIHEILKSNNIPHTYKIYSNYARFYIKKEGAIKIITEWKLNNPKHTSKFQVFNKFNMFFPFSTTKERLDLLDGKINIKELENICKKRKDDLERTRTSDLTVTV